MKGKFDHIIIFNIDGLRQDTFQRLTLTSQALKELFIDEEAVIHLSPHSSVPSITFTAQATITTGESPDIHEIAGNQFFDRLGIHTKGKPKFYALDIARGLDSLDAASVFQVPGKGNALLSLQAKTIYEIASEAKKISVCSSHMFSRGAHYWIRPTLFELYLSRQNWKWLKGYPEYFERKMAKRVMSHLGQASFPDLMMNYFMTLDTMTHRDGLDAQYEYFLRVIDPILLELIETSKRRTKGKKVLYVLVSDHGHIAVKKAPQYSLKAIGGIDMRLPLMESLRGRGSASTQNSQCVIGNNSGLAYVYIREKDSPWSVPPPFAFVKDTAMKFLSASQQESPDEPLLGVLVRNIEEKGWDADYQSYLPTGEIINLEEFFKRYPGQFRSNIALHVGSFASSFCGDLLLIPNAQAGFSFGNGYVGNHGGLTLDESQCVLSFASPGNGSGLKSVWEQVQQKFKDEPPVSELQLVAAMVREGF